MDVAHPSNVGSILAGGIHMPTSISLPMSFQPCPKLTANPNIFLGYGSDARMKVARRRPETLLQCLYTVDSSGFVMVCMFVMCVFDFPEDDIFWIFKYFEVLKVAISRMHMIIPWDAPAPSNSGK